VNGALHVWESAVCAAGDSSWPPPEGLAVFHIEANGTTLALLTFEVEVGSPVASLSNAERAVMGSILEGKSNSQIATERGTATRTVANQVARLFEKLGVRSRAELAVRFRADRPG